MYGGTPDGQFITDLVSLLNQFVPSDRIVSGNFFKWLTEIKFTIKVVPSHFVNATLFAHAVSEKVQDGFARGFERGDIKRLDNPKLQPMVEEANGILSRSRQFLKDQGKLDDPKCMQAHRDLKVDICTKVVKAKCEDKRDLEQIAEEFVAACTGQSIGHETTTTHDDEEPCSNAVMYDDNGEITNAGQMTFANLGLPVGFDRRSIVQTEP